MGACGPEDVYQINRWEATKEDWLQFRQEFEYHKKQENREEEEIMNNKRHHAECEEVIGDNDNVNGNLQHEEKFATLQFPI